MDHYCERCDQMWSCEGLLCMPCSILPAKARPKHLMCPTCSENVDHEELSYYDR